MQLAVPLRFRKGWALPLLGDDNGSRRAGISPRLLRDAFPRLQAEGGFSRRPLLSGAQAGGYFFPSQHLPLLYALFPDL